MLSLCEVAAPAKLNATQQATQLAAAAHLAHLDTLRGHVDLHIGECSELRQVIVTLRDDARASQDRILELEKACTRLETAAHAVEPYNSLATILTAAGSAILGFFGASPDVPAGLRYAGVAVGGSASVVGILLTRIPLKARSSAS